MEEEGYAKRKNFPRSLARKCLTARKSRVTVSGPNKEFFLGGDRIDRVMKMPVSTVREINFDVPVILLKFSVFWP